MDPKERVWTRLLLDPGFSAAARQAIRRQEAYVSIRMGVRTMMIAVLLVATRAVFVGTLLLLALALYEICVLDCTRNLECLYVYRHALVRQVTPHGTLSAILTTAGPRLQLLDMSSRADSQLLAHPVAFRARLVSPARLCRFYVNLVLPGPLWKDALASPVVPRHPRLAT